MRSVTRGRKPQAEGQGAFDFYAEPEPAPPPRPAPPPAAPAAVLPVAVPSGAVARVRANLSVLAALQAGTATPDVLAAWSGWGAVPEVFDTARPEMQWARDELAAHLDAKQIAAARRSVLNAHYTGPALVAAMWDMVGALGFPGGLRAETQARARVLEPGCGSGNFMAAAPPFAAVTGVELDPATARVAAARCPGAEVITGSFAEAQFDDGSFDLVIGNVPFGDYSLHDPVHNPGGYAIHNHFIIKSLRLTRPGGLVCVITSRYTLDSRAAHRFEMHALADLVAAVRLPTSAHQRTAGTRVVTDVLVFRRREPGTDARPAAWLPSQVVTLDGFEVKVNRWFTGDGTRWVAGRLTGVRGRGGDGDLDVTGDPARTPAVVLAEAARAGVAAGLTWAPAPGTPAPGPAPQAAPGASPRRAPGAARPAPSEAAPGAAPEGSLEGKQEGHILAAGPAFAVITRPARGGQPAVTAPFGVPASQAKELRALLALRDAALEVLAAETASPGDTPGLAAARSALCAAYAAYTTAYGPVNRVKLRRTGRVDEHGQDRLSRVRPPQGGFRADPHAPLVFALEDHDPETGHTTRAPIFTQRVIAPRVPPTSADSPADALAISVDETGHPDLGRIAALLGTDRARARQMLAGLVFNDPASPEGARLVPAAEYLSGNVRAKLATATAAARTDDRYSENVFALRGVVPADLQPGEISARLGAVWIGREYVEQFLKELLDGAHVAVKHPGGNVWEVTGGDYGVLATSTWGTTRAPAGRLAQCLLECRKIEVKDRDGLSDTYLLNPEETAAAQAKADELAERFGEWVWEDPARARVLAAEYNRRFNSTVLRTYDGTSMSLPGLSAAFRPLVLPHQYAAVARIVGEPSVLLAHVVGAGKTAEMVMGLMELRRLGLARKPAVVVPNHMLDQFAGEWLRLYPQAKVLITRREDLQGEARRRLVARIATGDWDGVILSRSAFERISMSPQAQADYLDAEAARIEDWLNKAKESGARKLTTKRLEKQLAAQTEKVKAKLAAAKDPGIYFEDTGIDFLVVDEAHGYKNLRIVSNIEGAAIDGSKRATDLDMKLAWLRERNGDRVAVFATATPIANSVAEMYVVTHYLRPDLLAEVGIETFDDWAATFGELVTDMELAPEGGSFRPKTRFARFVNVPELLRLFHVFADVKLAEDLQLRVPVLARRESDGQRVAEVVTIEASDALRQFVQGLGARAQRARGFARAGEDNKLAICTDGRKAALNLALVTGANTSRFWYTSDLTELAEWCRTLEAAAHGPGKVEAAATRIHAIWLANRDRKYPSVDGEGVSPVTGALQLVFCDMGTPRPGWNAYHALRAQLHQLGLPEGSVRFIHDARSDADKARLFAACRNGQVSVLIGSTEMMGVGTNVQHRAIALHHLDAPWRPADIEQRDGRLIRQGNAHLDLGVEVQVIRYVVAGSFDGYMWQTLYRKARFIAQVMKSAIGDVREIEDIGDTTLSFAEIKALATGNPLLLALASGQAVLVKLERAERAHSRNQRLLAATADEQDRHAAHLREVAAQAEAAIARRADTRGDAFTMTVGGVSYAKRPGAAGHLVTLIGAEVQAFRNDWRKEQRQATVGALAGFDVAVTVREHWAEERVQVVVALDGAPDADWRGKPSDVGEGLIAVLEHGAQRLDRVLVECREGAERCDREAARARAGIGAVFAKAAGLEAARAEVARVEREMAEQATAAQRAAREAAAGDQAAAEGEPAA